MAAFAVGEIFGSEGNLIIMTGRTTYSGFGCFVNDDSRSLHLSAFGSMAAIAIHHAVFGVTEVSGNRIRRRFYIIRVADLMTLETFARSKFITVFIR